MLDQYQTVPRFSNTFIAEQRDRIDHEEMKEATRLDAVEPATHQAWRNILKLNGEIRHAIQLLRIARENCGKGYRRVELYPGTCPGWFESRPWTPEFLNECGASLLWLLSYRKQAWAALRRAEAIS
jgi:hypothetical protein